MSEVQKERLCAKPRLLDLFCCEGGAAKGYSDAGFEVVGVDIEPRKNYPFEFIQADALEVLKDGRFVLEFDAIHASPPCQAYSDSTLRHRNLGKEYADLLGPTRDALEAVHAGCGVPWVIENVPGAPMRADYVLCGSQFGLMLIRHRWFEVSWGPLPTLELHQPCTHDRRAVTITGNGTPSYTRASREKRGIAKNVGLAEKREIMEMPWASVYGVSQAIPPAYTRFIGEKMLAAMELVA
jgi:DNA (cytosine-5)-methyltransferase 1